ncbi:MAG: hypothetical protein KW788_02075 [Candidatus Doudnabacteria bacterium]|nr:hypothetical protein [Candidatus Doudnabacteria bacterium]
MGISLMHLTPNEIEMAAEFQLTEILEKHLEDCAHCRAAPAEFQLTEILEKHLEDCAHCRAALNDYGRRLHSIDTNPQTVGSNGPLFICPPNCGGCGFIGYALELEKSHDGDLHCKCGKYRLYHLTRFNFALFSEGLDLHSLTRATAILWPRTR